ncbi:MAG: Mini-ribonuclease 3 [Bacillota bacterium]
MHALALAYVGDTVYDLFVRTVLVCTRALPVHDLHVEASNSVNAGAQARAAHALMDEFTEEELSVYKRGRNAKSHTVPKNANVSDYRAATGLEAVLGYLYLSGREDRAFELLARAMGGSPQE